LWVKYQVRCPLVLVPSTQPFNTVTDNIKLYVRRVVITDRFTNLLPWYLSLLQGIVDSDDLPLSVSSEVLQQHNLIKIIKKKLFVKL
jgi:heat shock protein beta